MNKEPKRIRTRLTGSTVPILMTLLILTSVAILPISSSPSSYLIGSVNAQVGGNTLTIIKQVICPANAQCPSASAFTIQVTGNNPTPPSFPGSSSGVDVSVGDGDYSVNEVVPNAPAGLVLLTIPSPECSGFISNGDSLTCTITNRYLQANGDEDGDNLRNSWEVNGIDSNNDGIIDFTIPNANPLHKNLYLEIDYMQFHRPIGGNAVFGTGSVIEDLRRAFRNAPVSNPDGATGVNLLVQLDDQIPHQDTTSLADLGSTIKNNWFGTAAERANSNAANLLAAKRLVFHYALFAHDQPSPNQGSAGVADLPGMNILATFGNSWAVDPATNHSAGSHTEQAFNLMHELGHNLGLRHGGNDNTNCKPNYLSVMSYLFSLGQLVSNAPLDYSRTALATLNKGSLSEPNGISQSDPPGLTTIYGPRGPMQGPRLTQTGVPVDWNFNGVTTDTGINSDISGGFGCGTPGPGPTLNGFNDWNALVYSTAAQQQITGLRIQQETPPVEPTERDVIQTRLDLLEGIDNAIQRLIKSEPKAMIQMPKGIFDTTHIAQLLKTEQLEAAIVELQKLEAKVIKVFGQEAAQKEVVPEINNLIGVLKNEEPSPISPPPPSQPPSHHDRFKDRIDEALDKHIAAGGAHGEAAQKIKDRLNGGGDRHK